MPRIHDLSSASYARTRLAAAGILCALIVLACGGLTSTARAALAEFQSLAPSPVPLTNMTVDPSTNLIYAQEVKGTKFFSYDPATDAWTELAPSPLSSEKKGGAAYLNGKIYTAYAETPSEPPENPPLGVYDIASNTWSTIANPLGRGTSDITAAGESLYLIVGTSFLKYEPATETATPLAAAPAFSASESDCPGEGFEQWGGLQPYQGKIYGHQGNGCGGFAVYDVESNEWTVLPELPENAVVGSAIDPEAGAYYAYGGYGGSTFMRYDIAAGTWTAIASPFSETIGDGGMAYVSLPQAPGVYVIEGENGTAFYRYTPEADVSLTKRANVATSNVGGQITYTIRATNKGPLASANVSVSDPLPGNVRLLSAGATQGSCSGSATVQCSLGTLPNGASATVTVTVTAAAAGTAANTASVSSETPDPVTSNNSAAASTAVVSAPAPALAPPAAPSPPPLLPARWLVARGVLRVVHGWVSAPMVNLNSQLTLSGSAQLVSYIAPGRAGTPKVLATNSLFLAAGATRTLYLHLNRAALAKLAQRHRFLVRVLLTFNDQFGRQVKPTGVYLLSAPAHKHQKPATKNKR